MATVSIYFELKNIKEIIEFLNNPTEHKVIHFVADDQMPHSDFQTTLFHRGMIEIKNGEPPHKNGSSSDKVTLFLPSSLIPIEARIETGLAIYYLKNTSKKIWASRVIFTGDTRKFNSVYGDVALEECYKSLEETEKMYAPLNGQGFSILPKDIGKVLS